MIETVEFFDYYNLMYLIISFFALIYAFVLDNKENDFFDKYIDRKVALVITITITTLVGLRAYNVGTDTGNYYKTWLQDDVYEFGSDYLLYFLMSGTKSLGASYQVFLTVVSLIYFGVLYSVFKRWTTLKKQSFSLLLFVFISLFFSLTTSINVIRQGLSLVFLLLAYILFIEHKKTKALLALSVALSFHLTAVIPLLVFGIVNVFRKAKLSLFLLLYVAGIIISYLGIGINNVSPLLSEVLVEVEDKRASYLSDREFEQYVIGFKPQFAAFNSVFLMISLLIYRKQDQTEEYSKLLKYYIVSSFLFFMAFQLPFSDRWGLFSWFCIPFLLSPLFPLRTKSGFNFRTLSVIFLIFVFLFFNVLYK